MNVDNIPSAKERRKHKETISRLENERAATALLLEQTQLRIKKLDEELEQRRALAAPIRILPPDILSHIFLICCGQERWAPLVLAAVCRRWKKMILSTPLAWSRIFLCAGEGRITRSACIATFLRRSKPALLHVGIRRGPRYCDCRGKTNALGCACSNAKLMLKNIDRIRCLRMANEWMGTIQTSNFPNLERLRITGGANWGDSPPLPLDMALFPRLRHLSLEGSAELNKVIDFSRVQVPQLRYLVVKTDNESHWHRLIQLTSNTLHTLNIISDFTYSVERSSVLDCPELECLLITDDTERSPEWRIVIEIVAPRLIFYSFLSYHGDLKLISRIDLENVVHLRTSDTTPLRQYPRLRILQLYDFPGPVLSVLDQLEEDYSLCSELQVIEFRQNILTTVDGHEADPVRSRIADHNMLTGSCIEFIFKEDGGKWEYVHSTDDITVSTCHSSFIH